MHDCDPLGVAQAAEWPIVCHRRKMPKPRALRDDAMRCGSEWLSVGEWASSRKPLGYSSVLLPEWPSPDLDRIVILVLLTSLDENKNSNKRYFILTSRG